MKFLLLTIFLSFVSLSSVQQLEAQNFDFDFIELQLSQLDQADVDFDSGMALGATFSFSEHWYITGNHLKSDLQSDLGDELEFSNWFLGFGYRWQPTINHLLYLQLSAETQKLEGIAGKTDRRGASIEFGDLYQFADDWQLALHLRVSDINITQADDRDTEFYVGAAVNYQMSDHWQLGLAYESGEFDRADFSVRLTF